MGFEPFTPAHWAALAFTIAVTAFIIGFRKRFRSRKADLAARRGIAAVLIAGDLSLYVWYTVTDNWGYYSLPFQLCTMTLWLSAAMLLTGSRKLYDIVFFLGILGALQALLTPNLDYTFPYFRYFQFFIAHTAIIAASVYMTAAAGYRPTLRSALRAWGWLHVLAAAAGIVNAVTGENFMFLAHKPYTPSLLDLLAPWPWYLLQLEIVAILLILLQLGLVRLLDRLFGSSNRKQDGEIPSGL